MSWFYNKKCYRGEHFEVKLLGGLISANMSTNYNPGTWFIDFGSKFRISWGQAKTFGLGVYPKWRHVYCTLLWRHLTLNW